MLLDCRLELVMRKVGSMGKLVKGCGVWLVVVCCLLLVGWGGM